MTDFEQLKKLADTFFDWPTEDRTQVTLTSAILFAQHILAAAPQQAAEQRFQQIGFTRIDRIGRPSAMIIADTKYRAASDAGVYVPVFVGEGDTQAPAVGNAVQQSCAECGQVDDGTALYCVRCVERMGQPAPITADVRAAFEGWASDGGKWPNSIERNGDHYLYKSTQEYWRAWQACAGLTRPAAHGGE